MEEEVLTVEDLSPYFIQGESSEKPITAGEVDDFTLKLSGLWRRMDYFSWVLRNSHGVHASTGLPDYLVWSTDSEAMASDVEAVKKGDTVTFRHVPGHGWHNIMIFTSQLLNQASAGYLLTNDSVMSEVTEQYCKGITATMKGMVYDDKDLEEFIMARNIIPLNHEYTMKCGRRKKVDYSCWRNDSIAWNAQRFNFKNNPYWGDVYVTNTRSKDDMPHIFRAAALLPQIISQGDDRVASAASEAYYCLQKFCQDIVDNGFRIRTKNEDGEAFIPKGDLASFVRYGKGFEKNALLTTLLIAYGDEGGINPGKGCGRVYELIATMVNYYNYKIIHGFHMTAALHALTNKRYEVAEKLIQGLEKRADDLMKKKAGENKRWKPDLAVFLLQAASVGMKLKPVQARLVHEEFLKAVKVYNNFSRWDLWNESVPDGVYGSRGGFRPISEGLVHPEELGFFLEYCYSPYKVGKSIINTELFKKRITKLKS